MNFGKCGTDNGTGSTCFSEDQLLGYAYVVFLGVFAMLVVGVTSLSGILCEE